MTSREEKADFTINSAPVDITFTCPHCRWQTGVPFEVVPGITSSIAGPSVAGIPVTHRQVASSFAVVSGHEDPT